MCSGRKSLRLSNYDYAQPGAYFVTICVNRRECRLGKIIGGLFSPSNEGTIADKFWTHTQVHFNRVSVDDYVIMPNHLHAIIIIEESPNRRGGVTPPLQNVKPSEKLLPTTSTRLQNRSTCSPAALGHSSGSAISTTTSSGMKPISPATANTSSKIRFDGNSIDTSCKPDPPGHTRVGTPIHLW